MRESVIFDTGFDTDYSRDNKVASLPQAWVVLTMPFPTISLRCPISEWEKEYATLSGQRTAEYTKLKETRAEVAELHNIRKCVDIALKADQPEQTRAKRHDLER